MGDPPTRFTPASASDGPGPDERHPADRPTTERPSTVVCHFDPCPTTPLRIRRTIPIIPADDRNDDPPGTLLLPAARPNQPAVNQ